MRTVFAYLRLYADCLAKAGRGVAKNLWTFLLPPGLFLGLAALSVLLGGLGIIGGFLFTFAVTAASSCYLYFVGEIVSHSKVSLAELKTSLLAYFWSLLNLGFVLWIVSLLLRFLTAGTPKGELIALLVWVAGLVLLNPAPEVIYLRRTYGGIETIRRSIKFIQENWIEWFTPTVAFAATVYVLSSRNLLMLMPSGSDLLNPNLAFSLVGTIAFHFFMVFRGYLFQVLDSTSHRQRVFRYRAPGASS